MAKKDPDYPPVGYWLSTLANDRDPSRSAAVRHIASRWDLRGITSLAKVLRVLESEQSEHVGVLRGMLDDYAVQFGLDDSDRFSQTGIVGQLVPVGIEYCDKTIARTGNPCGREAVPGTGLCGRHGGSWVTEEERQNMSAEIQDRILGLTGRAVATLGDLMDHASSEMVRMQSAVAILDRAGIGPTTKVEVDVSGSAERQAEEVRERLRNLAIDSSFARTSEDPIVDGEVVEDPTGARGGVSS